MTIHLTRSVSASVAFSLSLLAEWGVSHRISPMDESSLTEIDMRSESGETFSLLVPGPPHLSALLLDAEAFQDGAVWGYGSGDEMGETPVQVVNLLCRDFYDGLSKGGTYAWIVGYLLGCLSAWAEKDRQLALVGIAHLCFLVSRVPDRSSEAFYRALDEVGVLHNEVVRVYRGWVRELRAQGVSLAEAWRLALRG